MSIVAIRCLFCKTSGPYEAVEKGRLDPTLTRDRRAESEVAGTTAKTVYYKPYAVPKRPLVRSHFLFSDSFHRFQ